MPLGLIKYGLSSGHPAKRFLAAQPELKPSYDVIIIGGGGHGLATAYHLARYHGIRNVAVFEKGYIGVNGCSLTLGKVNNDSFYVHLIPETLKITNLSDLKKGSFVNIEIDQNTIAIVETVKNSLSAQKS